MNRNERLQWCKDRALKYVEAGDNSQALASMGSDLSNHPETSSLSSICATLGMTLLMDGGLATEDQARRFIEGFN